MTYGYRTGDPWVICDRTGYKVRMSQTVVEPDTGLRVRRESADPSHPADHWVYVPRDESVPDARPGAQDSFVPRFFLAFGSWSLTGVWDDMAGWP